MELRSRECKYRTVWLSSNSLSQLTYDRITWKGDLSANGTRTAFLKANISRGSSNQARHGVAIMVLWAGFKDILVRRNPKDLTSDMLILILQRYISTALKKETKKTRPTAPFAHH